MTENELTENELREMASKLHGVALGMRADLDSRCATASEWNAYMQLSDAAVNLYSAANWLAQAPVAA